MLSARSRVRSPSYESPFIAFESLPHRQSLALARSWRFGTASGIARLASLLATRHESHHRIHSALAVRQGFRHRATRFAPRDSARIPPPYSFGLGGSAGLRHRATRFAHRDSARIPASLPADSPILVAPQWPVSTAASSWQSNTRAPQVPMLAERRQSPREPHTTNAPTPGRRHLTVPVGPADAELPVHQIENRPTSARSSRRTVTRPLPTSKTIRYVRGSKLVRRSQADPQTTAHHGLRQNAFGLNRPAYVGNSRSPVRYTFTR